MTTAERDMISQPALGLVFFNTDDKVFQVNTGTVFAPVWENIITDSSINNVAWKLSGNTGTTAGTDFIGTNDDEAFEVHVYDEYGVVQEGTGRVARF